MDRDEMAKRLAELMGGGMDMQAVSGQERERVYEEMQHLDLKPGDKVRWTSEEYKDCKAPGVDEVVEVFRVFPITTKAHEGSANDADEDDFSVLFKKSGTLVEFCFDSRRFVKVE